MRTLSGRYYGLTPKVLRTVGSHHAPLALRKVVMAFPLNQES